MNVALGLMAKLLDHAPVADVAATLDTTETRRKAPARSR